MRNEIENTIDIVVSGVAVEGDVVPLAYIDDDGVVYDRRAYAKAKVDLLTATTVRNFTVTFKDCTSQSEKVTVDIGDGQFSHIILWDGEMVYGEKPKNRTTYGKNLNELTEGEAISITIGERTGDNQEYFHVTKNGQYLELYLTRAVPYAEYTFNMGVI